MERITVEIKNIQKSKTQLIKNNNQKTIEMRQTKIYLILLNRRMIQKLKIKMKKK